MAEVVDIRSYEIDRHDERHNHYHEKAEKPYQASFLNQLDYIPLISIISAAVRLIIGVVELVVGIFSWPVEIIWDLGVGENHQFLIIEGCANIFRSFIAWIPIVGNAALFFYDKSRIVNH